MVVGDRGARTRVVVEPRRGRRRSHCSTELRERGVLRRELACARAQVALHRVDLALDLGDARVRCALDPGEEIEIW